MSDSRPIQRYTNNLPVAAQSQPTGTVMTPAGPAVIQVIDMPTGLGPVIPGGPGGKARKVGGINVVGAVMRRWWLVLIVFSIVGGGAFFAGANMVKPQFEGRAKVSYVDNNPNPNGSGIGANTIHRAILLMNSRDIPLLAARDESLRKQFPKEVGNKNLDDPADQAAMLAGMRDWVDTEESIKGTSVVDVFTLQPSPEKAAAVANAYANALKDYCEISVKETSLAGYKTLKEQFEDGKQLLAALYRKKAELKSQYNFDANDQKLQGTLKQILTLSEDISKTKIEVASAEARYQLLKNDNKRTPAQELSRLKIIEEEKAKDYILKSYIEQLALASGELSKALGEGKTENHPQVKEAHSAVERAQRNITQREAEIASIIENKIAEQFRLEGAKTVDEAKLALDMKSQQLAAFDKEMKTLDGESRRLGVIKNQLDEIERQLGEVAKQNDENSQLIQQMDLQMIKNPTATFKVEQAAAVLLKEDKRIKVQAGGLVGGLFLGIMLALLVDKFDKRLRDPRDIEPLFGATLLGTIPKIQELKRVKGEQARNLIAEEFRIIRTQVLFGIPGAQQKLIAVTSPSPGDGKTSLAVNLAISIAKAGRRVLLIDGDLRKPDVHRVFNVPDSPGFAELIQGSHEPGTVIRKSEVDGLEILPAGTPISRPSELLSRPEMARLLQALGDQYDHIVIDTAPLLPVSDTHVLAGMMDGVIVSFNAEVDRDTVSLAQDILRRSRANIIGTVMNQVKYRQSGSYHRGKSAYDSYYNSPRGVPKSDKLATVAK
jgi:capsular exopolysaccharide synthesis family protein